MGAISGTKRRFLGLAATALTPLATLIPGLAPAQVVTDGSVGPGVTLIGPDYQITDDLGTRTGDNLFHSFQDFSIATGESATFSGPDEIENVISRVTGPNPSGIDGTLSSTMPAADFYFINPNGVTFGPNARLDVQGSFHVSTADELRFEGGDVFSAVDPDASGFSVAEPRSFGFFDANPGAILVDGPFLNVEEGETLSLVGGNITVDGGVGVPSGSIVIATAGAKTAFDLVNRTLVGARQGSVAIGENSVLAVDGGAAGSVLIDTGDLNLDRGSFIQAISNGDIESEPSKININANSVTLDGGIIFSVALGNSSSSSVVISSDKSIITNGGGIVVATLGDGDARDIDIVTDVLSVQGPDSFISNTAEGDGVGSAGRVNIRADSIEFLAGAVVRSDTLNNGDSGGVSIAANHLLVSGDGHPGPTIISSSSEAGSGNAGPVQISARTIEVIDGGVIRSSTFGDGEAGFVDIRADAILISGLNANGERSARTGITGISSSAETSSRTGLIGSGNAGDISIKSGLMIIKDGGTVRSATFANGDAGQVSIDSDVIRISNSSLIVTGINSDSNEEAQGNAGNVTVTSSDIAISGPSEIRSSTFGSGDGGSVSITSDNISMTGGAQVLSTTFAEGRGGDVQVKATKNLVISGADSDGFRSGVSSNAEGRMRLAGEAGSVIVQAGDLVIQDRGNISSSTFGPGKGGDIVIDANRITMRRRGVITASSSGQGAAGDIFVGFRGALVDGELDLQDGDAAVLILDNSGIGTRSITSEGGNITIAVSDLIDIRGGEMTAEVVSDSGDAGNIDVRTNFLVNDAGRIITTAESGRGGNITIEADNILRSPGSVVDASSELGISGTIVFSSPDADLTGSLLVLDGQFADASRLIRENCEAGGDLGGSTFATSGSPPPLASGEGLLPGFHAEPLSAEGGDFGSGATAAVVVPCP